MRNPENVRNHTGSDITLMLRIQNSQNPESHRKGTKFVRVAAKPNYYQNTIKMRVRVMVCHADVKPAQIPDGKPDTFVQNEIPVFAENPTLQLHAVDIPVVKAAGTMIAENDW